MNTNDSPVEQTSVEAVTHEGERGVGTRGLQEHSALIETPLQAPRRFRWNWKILAGLGFGAICIWTFRPSGNKTLAGGLGAEPCPVAASKVLREDLWHDHVFDAEFRPYQEIELHAKVSGFVESLPVDVGDRVTNGQLLATLEIPELNDDLEHARAVEKRSEEELKKAEADHEQAHLAYGRLAAVEKAKPKLVAQQEIDLAQAKDRAGEAAMEVAREQIEVAKSDVKRLQTMMLYCHIRAPFDGVVTKRFTDPGALIHNGGAASSPLLRVSENGRLRLVFPVSVSFVSLIKAGEPVEIRIESPSRTLTGVVSRFTREIEMATRTMEVEVEVPNPDLSLIPGMYASVVLKLERREKALVVPVEAVARQKLSSVYPINRDSKIEERIINIGLETANKLEVLSGLSENDLVMIGNRSQVKPGQKVVARMLAAKLVE